MASFKYAFSLSAEEVREATPPGTINLIEHALERTTSGRDVPHDEIRLNPKPSSDPADPLNWPLWRKYAILLCMSLFPFVANFSSASISSAFPIYASPLVFNPPVPFATLTRLISVNNLMLGASNLFWVPLANTYGRRPIALIALLLLTLSSMWAGLANSFNSLLAARVFMGIGGGPADTVAPDVVGEVFFVHQRGRALAIYTVFLALGPLLGGLAGSYIAAQGGVRWIHWTNVILAAVTLCLCFFFQPETLFDRKRALALSEGSMTDETRQDYNNIEEKSSMANVEHSASTASFRPFTFGRSLKAGVNRGGLAHQFLAPLLTIRLPGVWLVMLWYAGLVAGIVTMSTVGPTIVASPPYLWGKGAGLINVGGIIGSVLGVFYTYLTADSVMTRKAKHETHGFSEPEARLPTALPALFISTCGFLVFGFCAQNLTPKAWVGLEVGLGMLCFGLMTAPSIGFTYIIESYNAISGDCFVIITCCRAIISFAWTFFVGDWIQKRGAEEPFGIFAMLMGIFTLLTVPMVMWGKRTRIATAKWIPEHSDH